MRAAMGRRGAAVAAVTVRQVWSAVAVGVIAFGTLAVAGPTGAADALAGPAVTGIAPAAGPEAGGTSVTISGTNLSGTTAVDFGTVAASFTMGAPDSITATAPPGTGTVDVTVTTASGTSALTSADAYTYRAAPTVTSVTPSSGAASGGTTVTINGGDLAGARAVTFGGANATAFSVAPSVYVADRFRRAVTSGWGAADQGGAWTLQKGGGNSGSESVDGTNGVFAIRSALYTHAEQVLTVPTTAVDFQFAFDITWTQNIQALTAGKPTSGGVLGGVVARFQSANDTDGSFYKLNASWDANNGRPALMLRAQSNGSSPPGGRFRTNVDTGIDPTVDYPAGGPYTYHVKGEVTGSNPTSFAMKIWKVGNPEPIKWMLTATDNADVGPQSAGLVGFRGSCDLAKNGAYMNVTGVVKVGNLTVAPQTVDVTATAPPHASGPVDVQVTTPGGTSAPSATDLFTYGSGSPPPPPVVTGVSPPAGPMAGGNTVVISGTDLGGTTAVHFGTAAATSFTVNGPTEVTATAPPHASGPVDVTVTTTGATSASSSADLYTYDPPAGSGAPGVPTGLSATVKGTTVTLHWTNAPGTLGANVYRDGRKFWAGGWPRTAPSSLTQTHVRPGMHRYQVAGYDSSGQGPRSQAMSVIVP
ncbi:MAG TPA: IPT/TIG domain-containing protein [Acidimicrobiales bacterium]|nr:IPT/TIG domain-containing protein [Acidimicrobiales bacterium]